MSCSLDAYMLCLLLLQAGPWRAGAPVSLLGCNLGRMTQVQGSSLGQSRSCKHGGFCRTPQVGRAMGWLGGTQCTCLLHGICQEPWTWLALHAEGRVMMCREGIDGPGKWR